MTVLTLSGFMVVFGAVLLWFEFARPLRYVGCGILVGSIVSSMWQVKMMPHDAMPRALAAFSSGLLFGSSICSLIAGFLAVCWDGGLLKYWIIGFVLMMLAVTARGYV